MYSPTSSDHLDLESEGRRYQQYFPENARHAKPQVQNRQIIECSFLAFEVDFGRVVGHIVVDSDFRAGGSIAATTSAMERTTTWTLGAASSWRTFVRRVQVSKALIGTK